MIGLGTIINSVSILVGGLSGNLVGRLFNDVQQKALLFLSTVGSILIFCVGMNLVWGKKVRVANLLPAVIFAVIASHLPIAW